jgi:hypothetical protein
MPDVWIQEIYMYVFSFCIKHTHFIQLEYILFIYKNKHSCVFYMEGIIKFIEIYIEAIKDVCTRITLMLCCNWLYLFKNSTLFNERIVMAITREDNFVSRAEDVA